MVELRIVPDGAADATAHQEQYEQLRAALEADGYHVSIEDVSPHLRHGAGPVLMEVAIHIGEILAAEQVLRLYRRIRRFLRDVHRSTPQEPRRVVIYGPDDRPLSTVELPDYDETPGNP